MDSKDRRRTSVFLKSYWFRVPIDKKIIRKAVLNGSAMHRMQIFVGLDQQWRSLLPGSLNRVVRISIPIIGALHKKWFRGGNHYRTISCHIKTFVSRGVCDTYMCSAKLARGRAVHSCVHTPLSMLAWFRPSDVTREGLIQTTRTYLFMKESFAFIKGQPCQAKAFHYPNPLVIAKHVFAQLTQDVTCSCVVRTSRFHFRDGWFVWSGETSALPG